MAKYSIEKLRESMILALEDANGDHRKAFLDVLDARDMDHDQRTKQFKYLDAVVELMMIEWKEELNPW